MVLCDKLKRYCALALTKDKRYVLSGVDFIKDYYKTANYLSLFTLWDIILQLKILERIHKKCHWIFKKSETEHLVF